MNLKETASHITNTALLGESVVEYWLHYFTNRRFPKNQEFYVVYTSMDYGVPFQPDSALDYWLVNLKFIPTSIKLGYAISGKSFDDIRHAYVDIAKEGCAAFREVPTIMPHFTEHSGHALHVAQTLLKPINFPRPYGRGISLMQAALGLLRSHCIPRPRWSGYSGKGESKD